MTAVLPQKMYFSINRYKTAGIVANGPRKSARLVNVPFCISNLSSSGVSARMLRKAWNKLRCMNGKVFSRYTVHCIGQHSFNAPFSFCPAIYSVSPSLALPLQGDPADTQIEEGRNLQVPNPTSLGSKLPQARTSNTPCNPASQNTTIAAAKQRVSSGNRRTYDLALAILHDGGTMVGILVVAGLYGYPLFPCSRLALSLSLSLSCQSPTCIGGSNGSA